MDKEGDSNGDSACARVNSMCVFYEEGYHHLKHSTAAQLTRLQGLLGKGRRLLMVK
jgi:hypothetical protein